LSQLAATALSKCSPDSTTAVHPHTHSFSHVLFTLLLSYLIIPPACIGSCRTDVTSTPPLGNILDLASLPFLYDPPFLSFVSSFSCLPVDMHSEITWLLLFLPHNLQKTGTSAYVLHRCMVFGRQLIRDSTRQIFPLLHLWRLRSD